MYSNVPTSIKGAAAGAVALGALLAPTFASAALNVSGIILPDGAVFKSSTIFENEVTTVGQTLSGMGRVDNIQDPNNGFSTVWQDRVTTGSELTFVFDNFVVADISPIASQIFDPAGTTRVLISFTGGTATFYADDTPDFNPSAGNQPASFATATDGTEFLNLTGERTILTDQFTLQANLLLGPGGITDLIDGATNPNGALLEVDETGAGSANAIFDTNTFTDDTDVLLNSTFSKEVQGNNTDFPIVGSGNFNSVVVPEPSTLGLFGIGLIGLGFAARRRRQR